MEQRVYKSFSEPKRHGLTWDERWRGEDQGLITCWEVGRELRTKQPELARQAENGELPILGWKGGVAKKIKKSEKYGTLYYLAQWQGLRGDDLDIIPSQEVVMICAKTKVRVTYTSDVTKYGNA